MGRKVSLEDKIAASYLLNEQDMRKISRSVTKIVLITFSIELIGALLLLLNFSEIYGFNLKSIFFSLFHSISAFCNAGFSLFSDSFESFKSNASINFIIAFLIIMGGISFLVIFNLIDNLKAKLKSGVLNRQVRTTKLSLNTKAVLTITGILIVSGMLIIYGFEHKNNLVRYDLKTQYLSAFFQSVTLRTAGFNTIDISALPLNTLLIMIVFMFIGGASGSTAGGVKVNTAFVIFSYIKSLFKGQNDVFIFKHSLPRDLISKSFLIIILALVVIFLGTLFLSITEDFEFERVLFEVVSAFGTVGLSTGITSGLSNPGRIVITIIMLIGRIGPMTLIAALSQPRERKPIRYPEGEVQIG
jgi:trk system potassium uptake protein TrkH